MSSAIERSIGRLEGKVDGITNDIKIMSESMNALRASFDILEKGRLSRLEVNFATLQAEINTRAKNIALWAGAIVSGCISIVSGIIIYVLNLKGA